MELISQWRQETCMHWLINDEHQLLMIQYVSVYLSSTKPEILFSNFLRNKQICLRFLHNLGTVL